MKLREPREVPLGVPSLKIHGGMVSLAPDGPSNTMAMITSETANITNSHLMGLWLVKRSLELASEGALSTCAAVKLLK